MFSCRSVQSTLLTFGTGSVLPSLMLSSWWPQLPWPHQLPCTLVCCLLGSNGTNYFMACSIPLSKCFLCVVNTLSPSSPVKTPSQGLSYKEILFNQQVFSRWLSQVGHDGATPESCWLVDELTIIVPTKGVMYNFVCKCWLARDKGDGLTSRILNILDADCVNVGLKVGFGLILYL